MATGLRLRYGNLRIKDVQLVLHLPYMSVPFRLKQDRGMFSQFTLNKTANSDDLARVYRFDLAQDSEMISPTIPI
ncbi:hypothetical protein ABIB68_008251 [Bradyrhizobium sp. F1.2.2]